jgi:hypothetical protein
MEDLVTFIGVDGRPSQLFRGVVYKKYSTDKYFRSGKSKWARLHTEVWSYVHGRRPPKGYHVHHVDENKDNNLPSNLELKKAGVHLSEHMRKNFQENPAPFYKRMKKAIIAASKWSKTPDGYKFRLAQVAKNFAEHNQTAHKKEAYKASRFCGNNCKSQWRRLAGLDNVESICAGCGEVFMTSKYMKRKYCSRKCVHSRKLSKV